MEHACACINLASSWLFHLGDRVIHSISIFYLSVCSAWLLWKIMIVKNKKVLQLPGYFKREKVVYWSWCLSQYSLFWTWRALIFLKRNPASSLAVCLMLMIWVFRLLEWNIKISENIYYCLLMFSAQEGEHWLDHFFFIIYKRRMRLLQVSWAMKKFHINFHLSLN